jgi:ABC-type branched-subunit amino acid transport system ATPase component/ABC-type branched-subunit amino acid transport system permease subunit
VLLATWITDQLVFDSVVTGLSSALVALGIVLTYRSTRVINFAVGNMGLPAAVVMGLLCINYGVGFWPAFAISLFVGAAFAAAVELLVVRRLFRAPRVIVLVATIGVAQLAQAIIRTFPAIETGSSARYPVPIGSDWDDVAGLRVTGPQLTILVVVPVVAVALGWLLNRTTFGRTVTASADAPDLARLSGISPKVVSTFVWTIAGLLSSLTLIMLSGASGSPSGIEGLGSSTLNRALAAAVIGGLVSFPRTLIAGIGLGMADALLRFNFPDQSGLTDFVVFLAVVAAVFLQTREGGRDTATFSFAPRVRPVPERLRQIWWLRNLPRITGGIVLALAAAAPLIVTETSRQLLYTQILLSAVAAVSLVVVTGWSGQLSLGQMAFAGVGALFAAAANRGFQFDVGWGDGRLDVQLEGINWVVSILLGSTFAALVAVLVGVGALRVRGLLLAVVTFSFGIAAQQYIFRRPFFSGGRTSSVPFERSRFLGLDLAEQRTYYWFCLAVLASVVIVVARVRRSGVGRRIIAVRDNPDAAAAYTIRAAPTKLLAFAVAGALAGLAGGLMAGAIQNVPLSARLYTVDDSLQLVSMAVIGGLGSIAGAVLGALWVVGLPSFFPDNDAMPMLTSSMGLLILLLYFPGGLVQIGYSARDALVRWLDARVPPETTERSVTVPGSVRRVDARPAPPEGTPALLVDDVRVHFGGIAAVDGVSIEVAQGEVIGLIGTNGAGKSTLLNAIGGFVPASGRVVLGDRNITGLDAARRAGAGLGRTFQAARLFPELTVRETVAVALEARGRSRFASTALGLPAAHRRERQRAAETDDIVSFLGLGRYADSYIADLSTGTRRIVELAGLLAVGADVLCLDEPTAGVAQREAEAFGPLLLEIRRELGAAMIVIEHDMPLIMSISDRMYCLELGHVIAEGRPEQVRDDPRVIASYLGTEHVAVVST